MTIINHGAASLSGLRKDHKGCDDEKRGPPVRPVCNGEEAYNKKLSHIMSLILRRIWKNEETACENTEELLAEIRI